MQHRAGQQLVTGDAKAADPRFDIAVSRVLDFARLHLNMDVAWASTFATGEQVFPWVTPRSAGVGPTLGSHAPLESSYCVRVLDGRLPGFVRDSRAHPVTRDLPGTTLDRIGSYVGVPIRLDDGSVAGMLCCAARDAHPELGEHDVATLEMLARMLSDLADRPATKVDPALAAVRSRLSEAISGKGRHIVLQPIIDITTGDARLVEALTRFEGEPRTPDLWFSDAESAGMRTALEIACATSALQRLAEDPDLPGVTINLSPQAMTAQEIGRLLENCDRSRVVLEITEHAPVEDYEQLHAFLAPHRRNGLRVAVDDAGAGYASFRHILMLDPDLIKVDISLVRDIHRDPVRQAITSALLALARTSGAELIAEGVESAEELDTLARLGVTLVQGYLFCRPSRAPELHGYAVPRPGESFDHGDVGATIGHLLESSGGTAAMARPMLELVQRLSGLDTTMLSVLEPGEQMVVYRYVVSNGGLDVPEGSRRPWMETVCAAAQEQGVVASNDVPNEMPDVPLAQDLGLQSFLTVPVTAPDGRMLGTLCAGSKRKVTVPETTLKQVRLCAHLLGVRLAQEDDAA